MSTIKMNYHHISQITVYFKSFETIPDLTFSQKRKLIRFNETIEREFNFFMNEVKKLMDIYCEKDEKGNFIPTADGKGQKIKEGQTDALNDALMEIYNTEIEIEWLPFKISEKYFENLKCDVATIKFIEENFLEE